MAAIDLLANRALAHRGLRQASAELEHRDFTNRIFSIWFTDQIRTPDERIPEALRTYYFRYKGVQEHLYMRLARLPAWRLAAHSPAR
ncbi:hypothetical protein ACFQX6_66980 [Streptosporangium lutulentum]